MRADEIIRIGYRMLVGKDAPRPRQAPSPRVERPINPFGWTDEFIDSPRFLKTNAWKRARYDALRLHGARCQACGRTRRDGITINVDHVIPRNVRPDLALEVGNLQILCDEDNAGKGRRFADDWR